MTAPSVIQSENGQQIGSTITASGSVQTMATGVLCSTDSQTTEGCDENTQQHFAMCLEKAEMGDPSGFQQWVDANDPDLIRTGE